jgi:hypothetical protein
MLRRMSTRPEAEAARAPGGGRPGSAEQLGRIRHQGWLGGTAVLVVLVCCAVPALLASGALAVVGGIFRNPLIITAAAVAAAVVIGWIWRHRGRAAGCCPPGFPGGKRPGDA